MNTAVVQFKNKYIYFTAASKVFVISYRGYITTPPYRIAFQYKPQRNALTPLPKKNLLYHVTLSRDAITYAIISIYSYIYYKLTPDDCDPHMKHGVGKS